MVRALIMKFYAVKLGRQGPQIYPSWEEAKKHVSGFPGAVHKSFTNRRKAEEWLMSGTPVNERLETSMNSLKISTPITNTPSRDQSPQLQEDAPEIVMVPEPANVTETAPLLGTSPPQGAPIILSPEQETVLRMVQRGQSVFFTGSAGTGKSVLLREIIKCCGGRDSRNLAITASTGIASVNIGGSTLHSWAGIGLGKGSAKNLYYKILGEDEASRRRRKEQGYDTDEDVLTSTDDQGSRAMQRWQNVKTLIIDEISMIDGRLFDKLEEVARRIRKDQRPFGGIQLVLSGDFFQLPPVADRDKKGVPIPATLAFEATSWPKCVGSPVMLKKVFRQKDQAFVDMLNSMRYGNLDPGIISKFRKLQRQVKYDDGIEPTELFPKKDEVCMANSLRLAQLSGQPHQYNALDTPGSDEDGNTISHERMNKVLDRLIAPQELTLKVGAQVMLIKNLVQGKLVNGSLGIVIGFATAIGQAVRSLGAAAVGQGREEITGLWPVVQFADEKVLLCVPELFEVNNAEGEVEATRQQVPLILAWALSIHKSQGQTLPRVRVNMRNIFEKGQAYVALSRATSMETLEVLNFSPNKVMAHPRVLEWLRHQTTAPVRDDPHVHENAIDSDLAF